MPVRRKKSCPFSVRGSGDVTLGDSMNPDFQPYVSSYEKRMRFHYVCPVCGTESFADEEKTSCDACGCDGLKVTEEVSEKMIPWLFVCCVLAIVVGIALAFC